MKTQLLTGPVLGFLLLLSGDSGATAQKPADAVKKKLDRPIIMKGEDINTPLKDVLEYLGERYELTFTIDRAAFAKLGLKEMEQAPIRFVEQKDVPLGKALQRLLDQIPATYKIEGNGVVVIPPKKDKTE